MLCSVINARRFYPFTSFFSPFLHPSFIYALQSKQTPDLELGTDQLSKLLGREGLGSLNGHAVGTVDDELGKDTESAGNTEEDSVVSGLSESVVLEEDTGVGVDVREGVLGLEEGKSC